MKIITRTFTLIMLLAPLGCANTESTKDALAVTPDVHAATDNPDQLPQKILDQLQVHFFDLTTILSQDPPDMTQIKTQTSWIRKHLADLKAWSDSYQKTRPANPLPDKLHILINDMVQEVERDDMLDKFELQALMVKHTQVDQTIANQNTVK